MLLILGGGGSGEFGALVMTANLFGVTALNVIYSTNQETTIIMLAPYYISVSPLYTLYIKRENGPWYSFVGRQTPYTTGEALVAISSQTPTNGTNFTYYFTKN